MGIMQEQMAVKPEMVEQERAAAEQPAATKLPKDAAAPADGTPEWAKGEGEMPEQEYDDMVNRTLVAAFRALSTPEMMQQQAEILANPTGEAIGTFLFDVLSALQEKAGGKIKDEAMPGVLFGLLEAVADAGQLPPQLVAEATQRSLMQFLVKSGADPKQIEGVIQNMNYDEIAKMAEQGDANV